MEPTLKEIESARIDPEIATGQPAVVYDNTDLLKSINQNAQFKAQNDWRKYQQFLGDYQNRLQNQQEIADKQVADADRDYLKEQSVDLFADALKDPTKIYSPEFNNKLASIRAEATSSKAARDFAEANAQFIVQHPEFNTDENKAKIDDYLHNQTVKSGGRKMFTLDVPDVFDNIKYFDTLKDQTKQTVDASYVSPDQQFIHERQDTKYGYKPFVELVKLGYESNPKIQKRAQKDFEALPEQVKANFEDAKDYWINFGSKHFGGYDDITMQGKENITPNSNYLEGAKLAETIRENKDQSAIGWANVAARNKEIDAAKAKIAKGEAVELPFSPLPAMLTSVGEYNKKVGLSSLPISMVAAINPNWVDEKGQLREKITDENGRKIPISKVTVSIGKSKNGDGVYAYGVGRPTVINESQLKSNAESWLATTAKERKGQEVYGYIDDLYQKAKGTGSGQSKVVTPIEIKDNSLIFKGNKYTLEEVKEAGYKDFEDFKNNN